MRSLNQFRRFRNALISLRRRWLAYATGADIHPSVSASMSSTYIGGPAGSITVGEKTMIAFKTLLIARMPDGSINPVRIGKHCFIGGGAVILPGVTIGDECIVAAGAVVASDIPARCIAAGNPARILRDDIDVLPYGRFRDVQQYKLRHGSQA